MQTDGDGISEGGGDGGSGCNKAVQEVSRPQPVQNEQLGVIEDRAWALKRDWTDVDFQEGAEGNRARLQGFEGQLVNRLKQSCARALGSEAAPALTPAEREDVLARVLDPAVAASSSPAEHVRKAVLNDPEVLGSALDIVGAYLKNYEVDRAAAVVETVLPVCRERGGLWFLKALNHLSTVRMKQARPACALAALGEVEEYASARLTPEERDEAWEFWETVYRNFGWVLSSLGRDSEAIKYIQRAIDVKERVGRSPSWFDLWDLGRLSAVSALKNNEANKIAESQSTVTKALWSHRDAEPADLVMRAKIWHTVGECSFALGHLTDGPPTDDSLSSPTSSREAQGHYRKALKCFRESHKLFKKTEGKWNPLTGAEAQAVAWSLMKLGQDEEAKEFLLDALEASSRQQSGWGDGDNLSHEAPALTQAMHTVDRILEAHRRTDDRAGLHVYFDGIQRLCHNVSDRLRLSKERVDAAIYEKLISSCSMVLVASGNADGAKKSQELLRAFLWDQPNTMQAKLCSQMMMSLANGQAQPGAGATASSPGMETFLSALASAQGPT